MIKLYESSYDDDSECLDNIKYIDFGENEAVCIHDFEISSIQLDIIFSKIRDCSEVEFSNCIFGSSSRLDFGTSLDGCKLNTIRFKN